MKLLLTSEGLTTEAIQQKFLSLVGKPAHEITVAFIPTAAGTEEDASWIEFNKQPLDNLGVKTVDDIDLREYAGEALYDQLSKYDVIWVNGGNTFYLMYWIRRSGFDSVIRRLLAEGKMYVGVSAGSIVTGPSIEVASWKGYDDPSVVELADYSGLGLVPFQIFAHYGPEWQQLVDEHRASLKDNLMLLTDEQAIAIGKTADPQVQN